MGHRAVVIVVTIAAFAGSLALFRLVPQQFFPASSRPELLVDLRLPEGSAFAATLEETKRLEAILDGEPGVESYVAYVGSGSPRFYLPLDQQLQQSNFAQFVVLATDNVERERVRARLLARLDNDFPALRGRVSRLENGPPVGFPIQFRVSGEDIAKVRSIAREVAAVMREDRDTDSVQFDWDEPTKVVRLAIDQNKARVLGFSSQDVAAFLNSAVSGVTVTNYRDGDKLIDVVVRGVPAERAALSSLKDLAIPSKNGKAVPITQIADIRYEQEEGIVWRRNRLPTITVRADLKGDAQGPDVASRIEPRLDGVRAQLPLGYRIEIGGAIEDSAKGQRSIVAGVPLLVVTVLTLLMVQLRSFARTAMVVLTAPLGLIGVTLALLAFGKPFGFVAMLGTIALSGIIMRNSVILVDQIDQDIAAGAAPWDAVDRRHRAPLPADRADGRRGGAGDDPADAQRLLRPDGRRDDGRDPDRHGADAGLPAGAVRGVVSRRAPVAERRGRLTRLGAGPRLRTGFGHAPASRKYRRTAREGKMARPVAPERIVMSLSPIADLIADLKAGRMAVLVDEEDRENEGDLIFAADFVTAEKINFMATHGRGLICMPITAAHAERLNLAPMVAQNRSVHGTNFTVSIEAAQGVSTGISAQDRAHTIRVAAAPGAKPSDIVQPGHVFPLIAQPGGVLARAGHTEACCDLAELAGLTPAAVLCEIMNADGTMARLPDLIDFARTHGLKIGAIADLIHHRSRTERLIERIAERPLATVHGSFRLVVYREKLSDATHLALVRGPISPDSETLVRVHEPLSVMDLLDTGSTSHSWSIAAALEAIAGAGRGVVVLLHRPESADELRRRAVTAEVAVSAKVDLRDYGIGAQILRDLNVGRMRLLATPRKMPSMAGFDLEVTGYVAQPAARPAP